MKKARKTSARASAKKPAKKPAEKAVSKAAQKAVPAAASKTVAKAVSKAEAGVEPAKVAAEAEKPAQAKKPRHGLGRLGKSSLERPEIVPSLVLIPAQKTPRSPSSSLPALGARNAASASIHSSESALVLSLRDELHALLALLDEPPASP